MRNLAPLSRGYICGQNVNLNVFNVDLAERLRRSTRKGFLLLKSNSILERRFESCSRRNKHNFFFLFWLSVGRRYDSCRGQFLFFNTDQGRADLVSAGRDRSGTEEYHPLVVVTPWTHPDPHLSSAHPTRTRNWTIPGIPFGLSETSRTFPSLSVHGVSLARLAAHPRRAREGVLRELHWAAGSGRPCRGPSNVPNEPHVAAMAEPQNQNQNQNQNLPAGRREEVFSSRVNLRFPRDRACTVLLLLLPLRMPSPRTA